MKRTEYTFDGLDPVVEYFRWNGQREEFYRGGLETFSPIPLLLTLRRFPDGTEGQTYWYHPDGRGSVAGVTKHLGQSTHNYRYDAYGQLLPARGNWTDPHNHYTFSGKEWDEHLRLYEFGVRLYDPWAGVWLTQEPLPGRASNPRTLHRYAYVHANPVSFTDPYGLQCTYNILTGKQECFGDITGMGRTITLPSAVIAPPSLLTRWPQGATQPQCYLRAGRPLTPAQEHWSEALMVFGSLGGRLPPDFVLSPDTGVLLIYGYPGYLRRRQELVLGRGEARWGWGEAAAEYRRVEIFQSLFGSEVLRAYEEWAASGGVGSSVPVVGKLSFGVEWSQHEGLNPQVAGEMLGGELSLQPGAVMLGWTSEDMTGIGQGARIGAEYQLPHREFLLTSWEVVGELGLQGIQEEYADERAILEGMVLESGYYRGSEQVSGVEVLEWKLAQIWQLPYRRVP